MTAINLFRRLQELQPEAPVLTGEIMAILSDGNARVQLTGGGVFVARNPLEVPSGQSVFVQAGAITGPAPALPYVLIEI